MLIISEHLWAPSLIEDGSGQWSLRNSPCFGWSDSEFVGNGSGQFRLAKLDSDWHLRWHHQRRNRAKRRWGGVDNEEPRESVFITLLFTVPASRVLFLSPFLIILLISLSLLCPLFFHPLLLLYQPQIWMKCTVVRAKHKSAQPLYFYSVSLDWCSHIYCSHTQQLLDRNTLLALALCRIPSLGKLDSNHWKILLAGEREASDGETDKDSEIK